MLAIEFGNINIIKKTLAQQPNLSIKNKFGKTALMVAIEKGNKEIIEEIKAKLINVI
jgi:ankyrin repeat protein